MDFAGKAACYTTLAAAGANSVVHCFGGVEGKDEEMGSVGEVFKKKGQSEDKRVASLGAFTYLRKNLSVWTWLFLSLRAQKSRCSHAFSTGATSLLRV